MVMSLEYSNYQNQRDKVMEQRPQSFEDLIAINAPIRPGVGDWNEYIRRRRENIVGTRPFDYMIGTNGIIVYQEQYLLLANTYAGWDIAYSDKHIKEKNKDINNDEELKEKFFHDSLNNNKSLGEVHSAWEDICQAVSGGYGFNRSHAASYARLSFQTAYLKHYYPYQFYAALMTLIGSESSKKEEFYGVVSLLQSKGIKILPPDINLSTNRFHPSEEGILYKLDSVNCVGGSALSEIERLKPIDGLEDFIFRRTPKFVKINALENLIKAGCFSFEGKTIYEQLKKLEGLTSYVLTEPERKKLHL